MREIVGRVRGDDRGDGVAVEEAPDGDDREDRSGDEHRTARVLDGPPGHEHVRFELIDNLVQELPDVSTATHDRACRQARGGRPRHALIRRSQCLHPAARVEVLVVRRGDHPHGRCRSGCPHGDDRRIRRAKDHHGRIDRVPCLLGAVVADDDEQAHGLPAFPAADGQTVPSSVD